MSFHTTRWTLVRHATGHSDAGRQALSELCAAYYSPVVAFLRQEGREEDDARELAHRFFHRLLENPSVGGVRQGVGKFRTYLLGALKHFLMNDREWYSRQKRGGGATAVPLNGGTDTAAGIALADAQTLPPDECFDRQWALAVLERALEALEWERVAAGKSAEFTLLKPWLTGDAVHGDQVATARSLGVSEGALKVAVHRLRQRFRALVKAEIAQTLDSPQAVAEEMRHLFAALGG